jgi:hypothetical protein
MRRYCGVAAVFVVLTTVVWVGSAWTGDPPSPEPEACCPCFYVESTGYKTSFGQRWCFLEETYTGFQLDGESETYRRLRCGTICIEPVTVECTVTRYVAERRVKTVWWGWKQYEVEYTVYVPVQEIRVVQIPRLQGEWCGVDPCKYTTWKIRHENEIKVIGGGTTVGNNLYGKIAIYGLPGCSGVYKLRGERFCNGQTDGADGIDCVIDLCDTIDGFDGCATLDGYDGCPE